MPPAPFLHNRRSFCRGNPPSPSAIQVFGTRFLPTPGTGNLHSAPALRKTLLPKTRLFSRLCRHCNVLSVLVSRQCTITFVLMTVIRTRSIQNDHCMESFQALVSYLCAHLINTSQAECENTTSYINIKQPTYVLVEPN